MTPPPVASVRRPITTSTTPSLDFLYPGETNDEIGRLGGYRIRSVLGSGGMGVVLKAEDPNLKRLVALKVMKPLVAVHDTARKRFMREAQSAASINHDHVVRIYQVGEDRGVPYIAMELLEGEPLDTKLRREKRLSLAETLRITREVASGLAAAHRRELVHRDIKPANIVLEPVDPTIHFERTGGDGSGVTTPTSVVTSIARDIPASDSATTRSRSAYSMTVKIVDFGLARATQDDTELTQSGQVTGTPQYMSPEQAEGHDVDHRSDLFSLGCVMYRMLAGETPFSGRSSSALLLAITERPHKPIRDHLPGVPRCVEKVVDRLLAKKPDDRFQSALELMHALAELERQIASGQALDDIPAFSGAVATDSHSSTTPAASGELPTAAWPLDRWSKRSRLLASTFGLLLLFGLAIGWQYISDSHLTADKAAPQSTAKTNTQLKSLNQAAESDGTDNGSGATPHIENTSLQEQASVMPVEEWLQGRELVTVSQDGRGMYRTISEAVVALKAGQVIKVLDKGPYRENVPYRAMPPDTGLVSLVGTRVETGNYIPLTNQRRPDGTVPYVGWATSFDRLSGFHFHAFADLPSDAASFDVLKMVNSDKAAVVDNCRIQFETLSGQRPQAGKTASHEIRSLYLLYAGDRDSSVRITECDFIGAFVRMEHIQQPRLPNVDVSFDHNRLSRTLYGVGFGLGPTHYDIRHNVIDAEQVAISFGLRHAYSSRQIDRLRISITNNLSIGSKPLQIWGVRNPQEIGLPIPSHVRIHNNILRSGDGFGIALESVGNADRVAMQSTWKVSHNAFVTQLSSNDNFPRQKTDLEFAKPPLPYNADPSAENYLRITANSPLNSSGIGGDMPNYVGPFAAGTVSDKGDWFSRVRSIRDITSVESPKDQAKIERHAAEWALRIGGSIKLRFSDDSVRPFSAVKDLPQEDFWVHAIDVHSNGRVVDGDVQNALTGLRELRSLEIHHTPISDAALKPLRDSPTLATLHLEGTAITDAGIKELGVLPKLHHLQLNQTLVTEASIPFLVAHPTLKSLNIGSVSGGEAAAMLFKTSRWGYLGLQHGWVNQEVITRLAELPDLGSLAIYGNLPIERLRLLSALPQLKSLGVINHPNWSPELSTSLATLSHLDSFWMSNVKPSVGWSELATARPWVSLQIFGTPVPDQLFDSLDRTNSLVTLTLVSTTQSRSRLQRFRSEHPLVDVISDSSRTRDREIVERLIRLEGITIELVDHLGSRTVRRLEDIPDTEFKLVSLWVEKCEAFNDRILVSLFGLDDLRNLGLRGSAVTASGLLQLDQIPSLKRIDLGTQQSTPQGLQAVMRQRNITEIHFETCTPDSLRQLSSMTRLVSLSIENSDAQHTTELLNVIAAQFPDLVSLGLGKMVLTTESAETLLKLPRIARLTGQRRNLTTDVVAVLARHPSLQKLSLFGSSPRPWANLASLIRIQDMLLGSGQLDESDITHLAELPQLQHLTFDRMRVSSSAIESLSRLKHVKRIRFNDCNLSESERERIIEFAPAAELKGTFRTQSEVERQAAEWALRIGGTVKLAFPDGSIRPVSALKDLPEGSFVVDEIDVHGSPRVNDADARRYLTGLSGLRSLQIHHTSITDLALDPLRDSSTLLNLHIEATPVTDAGIAALGTLPKLQFLMLNQTKVTEACLPALSIQPELRYPDIGSVPASEAAAKILLLTPRWSGLGLHESWIHPDYIGRLAGQKDLRSLNIYGDIPVSRLRLLAAAPQLTSLAIIAHRAWSSELSSALSLLPQLDALHMVQVKPSVGWKELAAARPWRGLSLNYTHLPDELFDALDRVDSLAVLSLMQTTQTRSRLQRFRAEHPLVNVVSDTSRPRDREQAERLLRLGGIEIEVVDQRGVHYLRRLEDLPDTEFQLWSVYVNDCPDFGDQILASMAGLDALRGFNLSKSGVTDAGLATLDQFPKLSFMGMAAEHMTPRGLQTLARLPRLESLTLPPSTPEQIQMLAPLKLKIFATNLAAESAPEVLEHIVRQFPELTKLGIGTFVPDPKAVEIFLRLPRLQSLLGPTEILTTEVVAALAQHPSLQNLELYGTSPTPWTSLTPLQRIQSLLIGVSRLSEMHITRLAEVPQLQKLVFDRSQFSPEAVAAFSKLRHVSQIKFADCELSDSDWAQITAALPNCELSRNNSATARQLRAPQ